MMFTWKVKARCGYEALVVAPSMPEAISAAQGLVPRSEDGPIKVDGVEVSPFHERLLVHVKRGQRIEGIHGRADDC